MPSNLLSWEGGWGPPPFPSHTLPRWSAWAKPVSTWHRYLFLPVQMPGNTDIVSATLAQRTFMTFAGAETYLSTSRASRCASSARSRSSTTIAPGNGWRTTCCARLPTPRRRAASACWPMASSGALPPTTSSGWAPPTSPPSTSGRSNTCATSSPAGGRAATPRAPARCWSPATSDRAATATPRRARCRSARRTTITPPRSTRWRAPASTCWCR